MPWEFESDQAFQQINKVNKVGVAGDASSY
jgi:hypothetical protein